MTNLRKKFFEFVAANKLESDKKQVEMIDFLGTFQQEIAKEANSNILGKLVNTFAKTSGKSHRGAYIWGDVGRGKSMIMNFFFENIETSKKLKMHFHEFMQKIHANLEAIRTKNPAAKDHIKILSTQISSSYKVLYLDELQINNIVDAMLVGRVFESLMNHGVYIFITSNRFPEDLYHNGLQRENFEPFIKLIRKKLDMFYLDNLKDYRLDKIDKDNLYIHPLDNKSEKKLQSIIYNLLGNCKLETRKIDVLEGRSLTIHKCYGHLAIFSFRELCEVPLGAVDYLALCKYFNLFIIQNIPKLTPENHNEALRFITLVDCLYETHSKLICTAADIPEKLYTDGIKNSFEFHRTVSRLNEMKSSEYFDADKEQNLF